MQMCFSLYINNEKIISMQKIEMKINNYIKKEGGLKEESETEIGFFSKV